MLLSIAITTPTYDATLLVGTSYFKLANSFSSWQQAINYCSTLLPQQQWHLLIIDTSEKQQIVKQLISAFTGKFTSVHLLVTL